MKEAFRRIAASLLPAMLCCSLIDCKKPVRNQAEMITYINDPGNGLRKTEQIGQIKAELTFKPWQLSVLQRKRGVKEAERTNLKNEMVFVLGLSANNKELLRQLPFDRYSEMVQVLAFRMQEYIDIVPDDGKPVAPMDCRFQQTYGMGAANNVLLVFAKEKLSNASVLKLRVKEFGLNTGNLDFEIDTKDINNIPVAIPN